MFGKKLNRHGVPRKMRLKKGGFVLTREQKENRRMPAELVFLVALWTLIPGLILFFIFLGLSFFGASLQIQVLVVIGGIVILSIRTVRLYRGIRARTLAKVRTGPEVLVGAIGIVTTDLRPKGEVRVKGEFWQAVAKEGWIEKDREVEVVGMEGLVFAVRMVKEKA
jgi:membrane protein implicated in regulation of membrane protease activity